MARTLGIKFEVGPNLSLDDGINSVRAILRQCYFDQDNCHRGINCLKNYKKDWDEKNKVFKTNPRHDWASHGSDAFRVFAVGFKQFIAPQRQMSYGGVAPYYPGIG